jgi:two-component system, LuxR family, response regulator FixJ
MDGLVLQREIARRWPALAVIIMTGHGDIRMAVQAMRAGAVDFLEKPFEKAALIEAINRARHRPESAPTAGHSDAADLIRSLTEREHEVFVRLSEGHQNKVIAGQLQISTRTVEVHRARIMMKLHAKSLADLVKIALSQDRH